MFQRFTASAQQAVDVAQQEAHRLRHKHVGTEHVLLGVLRQPHSVAARALASLDVTAESVRAQVEHLVLSGEAVPFGQIPFTPRVKQVFELALSEATSSGQDLVDTDHLLLGIARENKGVAAHVLEEFDADSSKIRSEVMLMLTHAPRPARDSQLDGSRADAIAVDLSADARLLLMAAGARALDAGRTKLEPADLLEALLSDTGMQQRLALLGVDAAEMRARLLAQSARGPGIGGHS